MTQVKSTDTKINRPSPNNPILLRHMSLATFLLTKDGLPTLEAVDVDVVVAVP